MINYTSHYCILFSKNTCCLCLSTILPQHNSRSCIVLMLVYFIRTSIYFLFIKSYIFCPCLPCRNWSEIHVESPRVYLNLVILLLTVMLIYTVWILFSQETEVTVQAKQPDVERLLSEGQHLYKEKPSTQPVKVMKQPLAISITP